MSIMINEPWSDIHYWLNTHRLFEALIFGFILWVLFYTAIIIKKEYSHWQQTARKWHWERFQLELPSWWTLVENYPPLFMRTDTHYDWYFQCIHLSIPKCLNENSLLFKNQEEVKKWIEEHFNIIFDADYDIAINGHLLELIKSSIFNDPPTFHLKSVIRAEGIATYHHEKRVYVDVIFLISEDQFYIFYSQSSVLLGGIEGPYFEKVFFIDV
jgi:hypothetical protein